MRGCRQRLKAERLEEAYGVALGTHGECADACPLSRLLHPSEKRPPNARFLRCRGDVDAVEAPGRLQRRFVYACFF